MPEGSVEVTVDLDKIRAERAGEAKTFRVGGVVFTAPPTLPLYAQMAIDERRVKDFLRVWLGEEQEALLAGTGVTEDELVGLVRDLYQVSAGEAPASSQP